MKFFRTVFKTLAPSWLTSGEGERVLFSLGLMLDATAERMRQALVLRFPDYTEDKTSLDYLGRDRLLIRGIDETAARYASRLIAWRYPYGHRVRGNAWALLDQVRSYFQDAGGSDQATIDVTGNQRVMWADGGRARAALGPVNYDGDFTWPRFVVLIDARASGFDQATSPLIGDPALWGGMIGGVGTIGFGRSSAYADINTLRQIVADYKPAGTKCLSLLFIVDGVATVEDALTLAPPDGTWGDPDRGNMPEWIRRISI